MRVGTTSDGARTFQGWRDTALGINCQFLLANDGKTRCLPEFVGVLYLTGTFSDAACSQPIGFVQRGCGTPAIAIEWSASQCTPQGYKYRQVGGSYGGTTFYQRGANGTCTLLTYDPTPPDSTAYRAGAEVPASTYVELTETLE